MVGVLGSERDGVACASPRGQENCDAGKSFCTTPAARSTFCKCALTSTGPKTWDGRNQFIANAVVVVVDDDVGRELWRHSGSGGGRRRRRRDVFEMRRR